MKIYSIFKKNFKTVSRNWSYLAILLICPFVLILISGAMLKSNNYDNIKVGIIDEDANYDLNTSGIKNLIPYDSLSSCITDLTNSKASVCIHLTLDGEAVSYTHLTLPTIYSV